MGLACRTVAAVTRNAAVMHLKWKLADSAVVVHLQLSTVGVAVE